MPRDRTAALEACPAACLNVMLMASSACANRSEATRGLNGDDFLKVQIDHGL
jgi:hypothetical protein